MKKYLREVIDNENESLVSDEGEFRVGVFKHGFKTFQFDKHKRSNFRLTEWQAVEVLADGLFLIVAVFKFGPMNKTMFIVYDTVEQKMYDFGSTSYGTHKARVAPTLYNGDKSIRKTSKTRVEIVNNMEKGLLKIKGFSKVDDITFDIELKKISEPSVVSLEMDKDCYVYTEKDLLVPKGYIGFKGKRYSLSKKDIAILDDHRGYYPLSSGYDWITTMGDVYIDEEPYKFGLNITDFYKAKDKDSINENGYWLNDEFYHLPLASFTRDGDTWYIKDGDGVIDLEFKLHDKHITKSVVPIKVDYTMAFGEINGAIKTDNGEIIIQQMFSLAEERITQFLGKRIKDQ